jgi:hypothetical protein
MSSSVIAAVHGRSSAFGSMAAGAARSTSNSASRQFRPLLPGDLSQPAEHRNPRLWVQCMAGATEECTKTQTVACSSDFRLLVPLWRTDPLYHELRESHSSYEAQHDWWRDRYKVAADDLGVRPKNRDIGWHRLRANVAALVNWLRICYREGWLGKSRRNHLGNRAQLQRARREHHRQAREDAGSHGDHGRIRREGRTARPGQANTALATGSRRARRVAAPSTAQNRSAAQGCPLGRLLALSARLSPGRAQFRSKAAASTPQSRPFTPKDAPASYLETEASNCRGGDGGN